MSASVDAFLQAESANANWFAPCPPASLVEALCADLVGVAEIGPDQRVEVFVGHKAMTMMEEADSVVATGVPQVQQPVLLLLLGTAGGAASTVEQLNSTWGGLTKQAGQSTIQDLLLRVVAALEVRPTFQDSSRPSRPPVTVGNLTLDFDGHRAWIDGEEALLTALEFRLLQVLCERRNTVHSRPALLRSVWGRRGLETTRTVDTHVKRLRTKLKAAGGYIQTVRGVGYRFYDGAAPITDVEAESVTPR